MAGEKCGECGYDIAACNEIAMLRLALERVTRMVTQRYTAGVVSDCFVCRECGAVCAPADYSAHRWHVAGCIMAPRACDMMAATQVAQAVDDRRVYGLGFVAIDATVPGGMRRIDSAAVTVKFPTTVDEGKL